MKLYTYQAPYVKNATIKSIIYNSNGEEVGSIQRYYKSFLHSVLDMFGGRFALLVSFKAYDSAGLKVINAIKKNHKIARPDYYIEFLEGEFKGNSFHARQENFDVINPEFLIKGNSIEMYSKKSLLDCVRFYEDGKEVARWRSVIKEKFKTYIEIEEVASIQDPLFYAILGQMLYVVGD